MAVFVRLSSVIAAGVLFLSWVITNTFVATAEFDTGALDAVQAERAEVQQFSDLAESQRDIVASLARIDARLDGLGQGRDRSAAVPLEDEEADWVDAFDA